MSLSFEYGDSSFKKEKLRIKNSERITGGIIFGFRRIKVLKYEGEYFNGERHGKGKEFNKGGKLIYEGEYAHGKWEGKGKQYADKIEFGMKGFENYLLYEGEFKNGKWEGKGKQYELMKRDFPALLYEGEFKNGVYIGNIKEYDLLFGARLENKGNFEGNIFLDN